ncbi:hypothetical protein [Pedococcus sp.]|uniref:hypothetical protein n=1 Tax=Pedococcus sp. TaxID=2860345 RepID=UPI002E0D1D5F|nr:hypothetical protein [Pedococcus sp.]
MTRHNARTAGLIAAAAVVLLWSAWRIVDARLNVGTAIAAWSLWLVLAVALASAVAYLRELVQHRGASRRVGWRPVPGVALLWIAGLATVAVFGFLMPGAGAALNASHAPVTDGSTASASPTPSSSPPTASPATARPTPSAAPTRSASVSRSRSRAVPLAVQTAAARPRPVSTTSAPRAPATSPTPAPTSSPTSTPLVSLPLLPNGRPRPTK